MVEIPLFVIVSATLVIALAILIMVAVSHRFRTLRMDELSKGVDRWILVHKVPEFVLGFSFLVGPALAFWILEWYPLFIGLLTLGTTLMLYHFLRYLGVENPGIKALIVFLLPISVGIPLFIYLSPLAASILFYIPSIVAFLIPAIYLKGLLGGGLGLMGLGHEGFEALTIHLMGWSIFLGGGSPVEVPVFIFSIFLIFQVVGPLVLLLGKKR